MKIILNNKLKTIVDIDKVKFVHKVERLSGINNVVYGLEIDGEYMEYRSKESRNTDYDALYIKD